MPSPLIHLHISNKLIPLLHLENKEQFLLGSISPDAIHSRPINNNNDKRKTHFRNTNRDIQIRLLSLLERYNKFKKTFDDVDFLKGYYSHTISDNIWSHLIARYYLNNLFSKLPRHQIENNYYSECDKVDLVFLKNLETVELINILKKSKAVNFIDLLSKEEIERWKQKIIKKYNKQNKDFDIKNNFFNTSLINKYLQISTEVVGLFLNNNSVKLKTYLNTHCKEHSLIKNIQIIQPK